MVSVMNGQEKYLVDREERLSWLRDMWSDGKTQLYDDNSIPQEVVREADEAVFLAGPTSRNQLLECNWRSEVVQLLRSCGYRGWIFCPEPRGLRVVKDFTDFSEIHRWESDRLLCSRQVAFWIPRDNGELLGLNTNLELGLFLGMAMARPNTSSQNGSAAAACGERGQTIHVGIPYDAPRSGLCRHYSGLAGITVCTSLYELCLMIVGAAKQPQ